MITPISAQPLLPANPSRRWREHWPLGLLLIAFLALGTTYSILNPIFEAPDEIYHFYYVKHIADGHGLPIQGLESEETWRQEGSQPPLYYAIGALLIAGIETSDAGQIIWLNPQANIGVPLYPGNKNRIIHTSREEFPWEGTVKAVHILRLFSLVLGAGTVTGTYLVAWEVFRRRSLAILPAMLVAFTPQFLFLSSAVSNDNLVTFLSTLSLWLLIRLARSIHSIPLMVGLGITVGLAALSKLSGLLPLTLVGLALIIFTRRARNWRAVARPALIIGSLGFLIAGWWYIRNVTLYGDLTGLAPMLEIVGRRTEIPTLRAAWGEFEGLRSSFWAVFGWFNVVVPTFIYRVLDAFTIAGIVGLLVGIVRRKRAGQPVPWWPAGLLPVWFILVFLALLRWTTITLGSQGRLLFPAIGAAMIMLTWGLSDWLPMRWRLAPASALAVGLLVLAVYCPFFIIAPAYGRPPILTEASVPAEERIAPIEFTEAKAIRLVGYRVTPSQIRPGENVHLTLYWQCAAPVEENLNLFIKVFGRDEEPIGAVDTYPGWGSYPTSLWSAGEVIQDIYQVLIRSDAEAPTRAFIEVGFYRLEEKIGLPVFDVAGHKTRGIVTYIRLAPAKPITYSISHPTHFLLGNEIVLVGYDLPQTHVAAGQDLPLTLYWQARTQPANDYTVFVHLIDDSDHIWGQYDDAPVRGLYPTSWWSENEVVRDDIALSVPKDVPSGHYWVQVGMYLQPQSERRLPVVDDAGHKLDTRILLAPITIAKTVP